jgi:hypothetical protein
MNRFLGAATNSFYLTSLIRELQIHYHKLDEDIDDSPEDIEPVIAKLVNLKSLIIRSSWFDRGKAHRMQPLSHPQETPPALRSCKLGPIFLWMHISKRFLISIGNLRLDYGYEWSFSVGAYGLVSSRWSREFDYRRG